MLQGNLPAALALHHQTARIVNGKGLCGIGIGPGADSDPVARHKTAGPVLVQTVEGRAEGEQLPGNGPGQHCPAHGCGPAGVKAARRAGQLLGPIGRGGGQVEADAHHQPFQLTAFHVGPGFGQDAADLAALIVKVVHPFDAQFQPAQGLDSPGHGHRRTDGHTLGIGGREGGPQDEGEVDPLPGRAFKPPPQPPAPRLLVGREHQRTVGRTAQCQLLGRQVGALQRVVDVDGSGIGAHCFGAEGIAACQPVAPARGGIQRVSLGRKRLCRLVDSRAAHAQRFGQLLA